jgi:hypothetical protein
MDLELSDVNLVISDMNLELQNKNCIKLKKQKN